MDKVLDFLRILFFEYESDIDFIIRMNKEYGTDIFPAFS
jgi:hypothetical protein